MQSTRNPRTSAAVLLLAAIAALPAAHAATLYWDTNGATAGAGATADGTWNTTNAFFTTDPTGASAPTTYVAGSDVVFSAGSDVSTASVALSGAQSAASVSFEEGAYSLSGSELGFTSLAVAEGASVTATNSLKANANFTLNVGGSLSGGTLTGGKTITKTGSGTVTFTTLDAAVVVNAGTVVAGGGPLDKTKNVTVNTGGVFRVAGNNAIINGSTVAVNSGGALELVAGVTDTINLLTGSGAVTGGAGSELTVGGNNGSSTFSGSFSGDLSVAKSGTGTFTLSGASTATGDFTVNAGTFTLADTGSMSFSIGANGVNNSVAGVGVANFNGGFAFDLDDAVLADGNSWTIVEVDTLSESFSATFFVSGFTEQDNVWTNGAGFSFSEATGILSYSAAIPEPSSFAVLGGLAALGSAASRRRRRA